MKKRWSFDIEWKNQKTEPPLQDTYSARHLPNGKLTRYGMRKKLQEITQEKQRQNGGIDMIKVAIKGGKDYGK